MPRRMASSLPSTSIFTSVGARMTPVLTRWSTRLRLERIDVVLAAHPHGRREAVGADVGADVHEDIVRAHLGLDPGHRAGLLDPERERPLRVHRGLADVPGLMNAIADLDDDVQALPQARHHAHHEALAAAEIPRTVGCEHHVRASMLTVSVLRSAEAASPRIGATECQELKVLMKITHWLGVNSQVRRMSTSLNGNERFTWL